MITVTVCPTWEVLEKPLRFLELSQRQGNTLTEILYDDRRPRYLPVRCKHFGDFPILISPLAITERKEKSYSSLLTFIGQQVKKLSLVMDENGKYRIEGEDIAGYTSKLNPSVPRRLEISSFADILYVSLSSNQNVDSKWLEQLIKAVAPRLLAKWELQFHDEKLKRWETKRAMKTKSPSSSGSTTVPSTD